MIAVIVYDLTNGEIRFVINTPEEDYLTRYPVQTGLGGIVVSPGYHDTATNYVNTSTLEMIPRPEFNLTHPTTLLANMIAEAVITGIPSGTSVIWPDWVITTETDGQVEFSTDAPGLYKFRFKLFPYQDKEITIEALADL